MIKICQGSVFDSKAPLIAHQVNCKGVMGSGLAKQVRARYPSVFDEYALFCKQHNYSEDALGKIQVVSTHERCIANLFAQYSYGRDIQQTQYEALRKCLWELRAYATKHGIKRIAIPYKLGCGLAGGSWKVVFPMVYNTFFDFPIVLEIWKLKEE